MTLNDTLPRTRPAYVFTAENNLSEQEFLEIAAKLNLNLFIEIPSDEVDVYITEGTLIFTPDPTGKKDTVLSTNRTPMTRVSSLVEHLCLTPNDYLPIIQRGAIRKDEFLAAGLYDRSEGLISIDSLFHSKTFPDHNPRKRHLFGSFRTFKKLPKINTRIDQTPETTKLIKVSFDDLLISAQGITTLTANLSCNKAEKTEKTETNNYLSGKLRDINELNEIYFGRDRETITADKKKLKICLEKELRKRWGVKEGNDALIQEAIYAILPARLYHLIEFPKTEHILKETGYSITYPTTALQILNEAARACWDMKLQSKNKNYPPAKKITSDLKDLGLSTNLARHGAIIIRPESEQRERSRRAIRFIK